MLNLTAYLIGNHQNELFAKKRRYRTWGLGLSCPSVSFTTSVTSVKSSRTFAMALLFVGSSVAASSAATVRGIAGDGHPSVYYVTATGEFGIQPDGVPIGIFEIRSESGIFTADAVFPPGTLFDINTATRKGWAALGVNAIRQDFSLGVIATSGLSTEFLLHDLTLAGPGSLEGPRIDLVIVPEPATIGATFVGIFTGVTVFRRRRLRFSKSEP
jgi:hypothetical protein